MTNPHKLFEDYLVKTEGRYTLQKRAIVDEINRMKHHFEVEDFIDRVRAKNNRFSRATVYRTIKQLFDAGLIQKITTREGKVFYEQNFKRKHHDHIICNHCGKIMEITEHVIDNYLEDYCRKIGFDAEYRSLHIYGRCENCRKAAA